MIHIIVGSMLGASEYVADAVAEFLSNKGVISQIHLQPDLAEIEQTGYWIVVTSTHGAGELPDNIQAFSKQITSTQLPHISFLVIALGDTSYDTFCAGGKTLHSQLIKAGAVALQEPHCIDVLEHTIPEDNAIDWLTTIYQDTFGV